MDERPSVTRSKPCDSFVKPTSLLNTALVFPDVLMKKQRVKMGDVRFSHSPAANLS